MFLSIARVLKFSLQDFWRNFWLSLVTITVLLLALFSVNILISLNALSSAVINAVEEKVDITIGISKSASKAEVDNLQAFVKNIPGVASVTFFTRDQVLESFREKNKDNQHVQSALSELKENPFNDTIIIKANDTKDYKQIIWEIQHSDYQQISSENNFASPEKVITVVESITSKIEKFGLLLTAIFAFIALLIVFNTIRVTIYTHRDEIGVMRLVGATNSFIQMPYLVEGVMYAVLAIGIHIFLVFAVLRFLQPYLLVFFQVYGIDLVTYFTQHGLVIFGLEFLAMMVMNILSSGFAIRRYLRV